MRFAVPVGLLLLVLAFYWKLTFSGEFVWFDHPDMCYIEIPRLQFQAREFQLGHFPLWDPDVWAGQSLIGQTQPGPLFPFNLVFLLLPQKDGYIRFEFLNWYWVLLHAFAALACYALCRDWGRSHSASGLAGLGFGCAGFLGSVAWLDVAAGATFTPLILLFLARAVEGRRRWGNAALSGLFLGMAWLSGHHEIPLLVSLMAGCVWLGCAWTRRSTIPLAAVSLLIGALIASAQMLPTIEFGRLARRWVGVTNPVGWNDPIPYSIATVYSLPARGILETFLPSAERYADCAPYLGLAIGALALLGIAAGGRAGWVAVGTSVALLFALGAGTPLHGLLSSLIPGLSKARIPVRAIHLFNLGLCILAAYGLDRLMEQSRQRVLAWGMLLFGVVVTAWAIGHSELDNRLLLSGFLALGLGVSVMAGRMWPYAWIGVALIEMHGVTTANYSSLLHKDKLRFVKQLEDNRDVAEAVRNLEKGGPIRLDVKDEEVPLNFGDYHGLEVLGGYVAGVPENLILAELHEERTKTLFGVTHYLAKEPARAGQDSMFEGRTGVKVFRNPEARPRAWSVHEVISTKDQPELHARVLDPQVDLHRQVVLAGAGPALEKCDGDTVEIASRTSNRVRIRAKLACTGMVILGDAYYPGWEATVDGKPARIWEAYGAIRGVVTPAGDHVVEMRFRPRSVFLGAGLFVLGLLLTGGLCMVRERKP